LEVTYEHSPVVKGREIEMRQLDETREEKKKDETRATE
jgi:hypothetical protein